VQHPDRRRLAWQAVPFLVLGLAGLGAAGFAEDPQSVYTALAAVFTFLALVAAGLAVRLTWPQYDQWRKAQMAQPSIRVNLEVAPHAGVVPQAVGQRAQVGSWFILRVIIANDGDAPMRDAVLNIVVLTTCQIRPIDPAKTHYLCPVLGTSTEIVPGESREIRWTVARDDVTPGAHVFHAEISPGGVGPWPILVELTGDPSPAQRFTRLEAFR
jgi:hypothetical protein